MAHALRHGQHGLLPGQRLADDAREEARRRAVRFPRPHADRRQPDADAVEEAAAAVVGEEELVDRLLRAIARERRAEEFVPDRFGKRRAEDGDRGGEHHARLIAAADGAYRLEEAPRAVEVDAVALVEIGLGLPGDHRGEVHDHVRLPVLNDKDSVGIAAQRTGRYARRRYQSIARTGRGEVFPFPQPPGFG